MIFIMKVTKLASAAAAVTQSLVQRHIDDILLSRGRVLAFGFVKILVNYNVIFLALVFSDGFVKILVNYNVKFSQASRSDQKLSVINFTR